MPAPRPPDFRDDLLFPLRKNRPPAAASDERRALWPQAAADLFDSLLPDMLW
ncbi:hypothetical protein ACFOQM_10745 [Paenibacillus sp. GCM10012307]|uniref:Uncharacterized protein n=1 Tax=Paenibacillus roseus TaxID=2798579 RepID=A0A934J7E1_9BACL|nr:hypothetical protein [Paenibacillus roseus]MBJ6361762.1 hypothetical protein [Paenibacillus roseus]